MSELLKPRGGHYWHPHKLPRPRYGIALAKVSHGPTILIVNIYGRTADREDSKASLFNKLNSNMKELKTAFNMSLTIVAGDFNIDLDTINKSNRLSVQALNLLISDHCLIDSYRICHPVKITWLHIHWTGRSEIIQN